MSIIKAKKCEVEIQEQTIEGAAAKYVVILSYEPEGEFSKEIISIVLTNPVIKYPSYLVQALYPNLSHYLLG